MIKILQCDHSFIIHLLIEWRSVECYETKIKIITLPFTTDADNLMNQSELKPSTCTKGQAWENTPEQLTILVLLLLTFGWESGARFCGQSQSVTMQSQNNCKVTFNT